MADIIAALLLPPLYAIADAAAIFRRHFATAVVTTCLRASAIDFRFR